MLDNQKLRDENNGVAHFKETLRPYFVKGVSYIFMWRFMYLFRCWRTNAMDLHNLDYPGLKSQSDDFRPHG